MTDDPRAQRARALAESLFKTLSEAADVRSEAEAARIAEAAKTARLRALRLEREAASTTVTNKARQDRR